MTDNRVIKRFESFQFGICKCGCGKQLINITGTNGLLRKYIYKHHKNKKIIPNEIVYCACGCKRITNLYKGRYKKYIHGHNSIGSNNPAFKGGRSVDRYIKLYMPWHSNSNKKGQIYEHMFILSKYLKRPLEKGEEVHHINENKHDNRIENLQLILHSEHTRLHTKGRKRK
jgi:hypothetical protein